jgi:hypothetical protein
MIQFKTLNELYEYLETTTTELKYIHNVNDLFRRLRDVLKEHNAEESQKAQWETDFFNFLITGNECKPKWSSIDKNSRKIEYPSFIHFSDETYKYLISRFEFTSNPWLRARYAHLLWLSPFKNKKYAIASILSYLKAISIHEKRDKSNPENNDGDKILEYVKCAFYLSIQIKYEIEKIKNEIKRLINQFNFKSSWSYVLRSDLIELMLKHNKRFKSIDFENINGICWDLSHELINHNRIHNAIDFLTLGEKVEKKLNVMVYDWIHKIAELYEVLTKQSLNDLSSIQFCQLAIINYRKVKKWDKVKELENKFKQQKKTIKLGQFKQKVDISKHIKNCRKIAKQIVRNNDPETILNIFIVDKNLLPSRKELEKKVKQQAMDYPLQHVFSHTLHDSAGNPIQNFTTDEEKFYYEILQLYKIEIYLDKKYIINDLFYYSVQLGKLTTNLLAIFLKKNSWFGKNLSKVVFGHEINYNWLNLIMPSIHEYIFQLENINSYYCPNFVLSIDSLTLKIEGILRDFCSIAGITTFKFRKDKNNNDIAQEKDIHTLLEEDPVKKLFDEDDLLFFRFLLIEKAGYNLRHKVAHSLMYFDEYSIEYMNLLILCLLKLGKYDFV